MIVSVIKQDGLKLSADDYKIPFQLSAGVKMQFIQDENYVDYAVMGFFKKSWDNEEKKLVIDENGIFSLAGECFEKTGTLSISFVLLNSDSKIHLGVIDYEIRKAFGSGDEVLPEPDETWITLVTQVAKDAIKDDVALVNQKASEALNSATLASEKANEASLYANNAKEASNNATTAAGQAITAKNDAIAASNQALGFSNNASESATEAKNSADEALENANASNKAIETVNQIKTQIEDKANEFDTNYQEKLSAFNDNATEKQNTFNQSVTSANDLFDKKVVDANNDLDSKLQQANTTIDEKVTEATNQANEAKKQAQIATDEVNKIPTLIEGKLDKNLGLENKNKVLVTDEEGNVITQNKEDFEGGGTGNYNDLENKPTINGIELSGNKNGNDIGLVNNQQGAENNGKVLGIGPDGIVTPVKASSGNKLVGEVLLAEYTHQGNQEIHFSDFDFETGIGTTTEPHGLSEATKVQIVPNDWNIDNVTNNVMSVPIEWTLYANVLYLVPIDENKLKLTQNDKQTIINVNLEDISNTNVNINNFHFEIPIMFEIKNLDSIISSKKIRINIFGYAMNLVQYRYMYITTRKSDGSTQRQARYINYLGLEKGGNMQSGNCIFLVSQVVYDITTNYITFQQKYSLYGRRKNYSTLTWDRYFLGEASNNGQLVNVDANPTNVKSIYSTGPYSQPYAYLSNNTVIKIYALEGEYNES